MLKQDSSNPAIDGGSNSALPPDFFDLNNDGSFSDQLPFDARGEVRIVNTSNGGGVDLGAVEVQVDKSLVVDTALDVVDSFDGMTSLREAIGFVNAGELAGDITFDASVFNGESQDIIRLVNGSLPVVASMTIDGDVNGDGVADVVISGDTLGNDILVNGLTDVMASSYSGYLADNVGNLFYSVVYGTHLALKGLVITGGHSSGNAGGAVRALSDLTITDSVIAGNHVYNGPGGGIFAYRGLNLISTVVDGNVTGGYTGGEGGGVYAGSASGNVLVLNSTISNNLSAGTGYAPGGGFRALNDATIIGSTITGNQTYGSSASGGGISVSNDLLLINSTVEGNSTQGDFARGGGAAAFDIDAINSTVTGNYTAGFNSYGGGLYAVDDLSLANSIVLGNITTYAGVGEDEIGADGLLFFTGANRVGANAAAFNAGAYGNVNNGGPAQIFAGVVNNNGVGAGLLADNGGQALTVALKDDPSNPALNTGLIAAALGAGVDEAAFGIDLNGNGTATDVLATIADLPFDNRGDGFARIIGTGLDLGAFEVTVAGPFQGTAGADTLYGTDGNDILNGFGGDDVLNGQGGNDIINGAGGDDELNGGGDDDVLNGGPGADAFNGNGGTDTASFSGASAGVTVYLENSGPNTGDAAGDTFSSIEDLIGTAFGDDLRGTAGVNAIFGRQGVDFIYGLGGADQLFGEDDNDFLVGGADGDLLDGGGGTDRAGYWTAAAGVTADLMTPGNNTGDAAGDSYVSIENMQGSAHDDDLRGDGAANLLVGNNGDDVLRGRGGNDVLQGQNDNDILIGDAGADQLDGGAGQDDRASYIHSGIGLVADLSFTNANTGEAAGDAYIGIEGLEGSNHADDLRGDNGANTLLGQAGDDMLFGRGGNDRLFGGANDDILIGGAGADQLDGGAGQDEARYHQAGVGIKADLANSAVNTGEAAGDTYAGIENLFGSNFGDTLSGDDFANVLAGHGGNDTINGRGGADLLLGGDGDDNLIGGAGVDHYNGGNGVDRVQYQDSAVGLRVDLQVSATNTGDAAGETYLLIEDIVASSGNDSLFGNASDNRLFGFDGVDRVFGRAGNDTLFGGDGNDIVNGGAGNDILVGGADVDTFRFDGATFGSDRITDFTPGETIDLEFYAGLAFTDLTIVDVAGRAEVSFAAGEIVLTGILAADVMESWFSFAP